MKDHITEILKLQEKKRHGLLIADSYSRLSVFPNAISSPEFASLPSRAWSKRAAKIRDCGSFLKFGLLASGGCTLISADFCRERLCPACQFRRSLKAYANISKVLEWVDNFDNDHNYFFLTLTVRNVDGCDLGLTLDMMSTGWNRWRNNKAVKKKVLGTIRTVEVTVNPETQQYHPHYHIILAMPKSYGPRNFDEYWNIEKWASIWQKSCKLSYSPTTSIRIIRNKVGGVKETSKYAVKTDDLLLVSDRLEVDRRVHDLTIGLHGKRLLGFSGIFSQAKKALAIADECEDDLTDDISRTDVLTAVVVARWGFGYNCYHLERIDLDGVSDE